jgi:uncharacterized protein DUF3485
MAPDEHRFRHRPKRFVAPVICLLLLSGLATDRILFHLPVGDAAPYHDAVREAVLAIPTEIGDWVGEDVPVQAEATKMLRPNVILSRRFVNRKTGVATTLLIVHCKDPRDMGSHFPPVCYPSSGWELPDGCTVERDWQVEDLTIPGKEYTFESGRFDRTTRLIVYNFVLRPDGLIERDVSGLREAGYDARKKPFGGGQVQLVFEGQTTEEEREQALQGILAGCLPAIRRVIAGQTK